MLSQQALIQGNLHCKNGLNSAALPFKCFAETDVVDGKYRYQSIGKGYPRLPVLLQENRMLYTAYS